MESVAAFFLVVQRSDHQIGRKFHSDCGKYFPTKQPIEDDGRVAFCKYNYVYCLQLYLETVGFISY